MDGDAGDFADLRYSLINVQDAQLSNAIEIDEMSGKISNRAPLNGEIARFTL